MVQELASAGYSNVSDLVTAVQNTVRAEDGDLDEDKSRHEVLTSMRTLVEDGFFARVQPVQLQIPHDARQDADERLSKNPPTTEAKLKGKKAQEQHLGFVDTELEQRTDSFLSIRTLQAALDIASAAPRDTGLPEPEDLQICVNYSRAVKATRNGIMSQHATKTFGENQAKIVTAVMQQTDLTVQSLSVTSDPDEHQLLNLSELAEDISQQVLTASTTDKPRTNGWHHDETMANGVVETNGQADHDDVDRGLQSLAEGPFSFLKYGHDETWKVNKVEVRKLLVRQEIMKIARQRSGIIGVRLMRMLMDKGRLDEKVLQEIGLLNAKEMRKSLGELHQFGYIELQEVPRDPQRQPNRTIFLWFYDEARVQKKMLDDIYKSMARLYQRMQFEREKMRPTLEKIEKEDCEGREEDFMSTAEVTLLEQFRRKETWLLGEISRLDDSVAFLRDL